MGKDSKIEWTDHTFNPWVGCQKVSAGCANCYAERDMTRKPRWANAWGPPETSERLRTKTWRDPVKWNKQAEAEDTRHRVFCASLGDVFEDNSEVINWRLDLFGLIETTPHLDWLILTKRPEIALRFFQMTGELHDNIWMGVSVENQETANERIPRLLKIPAAMRFVSCEPLLGRIDFAEAAYACKGPRIDGLTLAGLWDHLHWVIVGGESGPQARPMHTEWVRDIRDQCQEADVPFFFKQWGEWDQVGMRVGRKRAGHLLDGKEWHEFPEWNE